MRLDLLYVLGPLWGGLSGPQVCPAIPPVWPAITLETAGSTRPGARAGITAFVDVNVVPMDTERVLPNHTVLVEDGRITVLGPSTKVKVPAGAVRIDGRGKYLMPGLADMHAHFSSYDHVAPLMISYLASGVTALRQNNPISIAEAHEIRYADAAKEKLGPHIYLAGWTRDFDRPGISAESAVTAYRAAGYDYLVDRGSDAFMAAARGLMIPLGSHSHTNEFAQMLTLGADGGSIDHLFWVGDTLGHPRHGGAVSEAELRAVAASVRRAGTWVAPTLDCMEYAFNPPPAARQVMRRIVKALQDAGVGLLLGAERVHVYRELATLVGAGLSPYQALVTGTRNVAQYLGTLDSSGTVAVSKRADLLLLNGNPLQDVRHILEPAGVMMGGRWLDRAELDQRLLAYQKPENAPGPKPASSWFELEVRRSVSGITEEQRQDKTLRATEARNIEAHIRRFEGLADSLAAVNPSGQKEILQRLAAELGAMRAILPPEEHVLFDPIARVWLRAQVRQGHPVTVPGITVTAVP